MESPLIKGMFVNSHIEALRKEKGDEGVRELEHRYGKPLSFRNLEDVPVREEVRVIEIAFDIMTDDAPIADKSFEAGRLHFRNFINTPFGRMVDATLPKTEEGLVGLLTRARYIARHVFKNTNFSSSIIDDRTLLISMENCDYPIDHFRGLFYEWMNRWGFEGHTVTAKETKPNRYEYTLSW